MEDITTQETFDGSARVDDDEAVKNKEEGEGEEVKKEVKEDIKPLKDVFKYVQLVAKNKRRRRREVSKVLLCYVVFVLLDMTIDILLKISSICSPIATGES